MTPTLFVSLASGIAFFAGVVLYHFLFHSIRSFFLKRRFSRGAEGEKEAKEYLLGHGYHIHEDQASRCMRMLIDGSVREFNIRADFIAEKNGRTCIVEVKTGGSVTDPASTATRRQLLEYAVSYDVDDIFLFDADSGILHKIELPTVRIRTRADMKTFLKGTATGFFLAVAVFILVYMFLAGS